jgi:hypothetical protein
MRKTAVTIIILANLYLLYFYIIDIVKYFSNQYNYDGMRYLIPLFTADIFFLVSLILMFFSSIRGKYFFGYVILAVAHNLTIGIGIENTPFAGLLLVIMTVIYIFKIVPSAKSSN